MRAASGVWIDAGSVTGSPVNVTSGSGFVVPEPSSLSSSPPQAARPSSRVTALAAASLLFNHYGLRDVLGHEDIAPGRKSDPGPAFPMASFRGRIVGRSEDEGAEVRLLRLRTPFMQGGDVREVQQALYAFDPQVNVNQPLTVQYETTRNSEWPGILARIERERVLVRSRAGIRDRM